MAGEEEEDVLSLSEAIRYFFSEQPAQARAGGLIIEDEGRDEAERREPRGDLGGVERRALELGDPGAPRYRMPTMNARRLIALVRSAARSVGRRSTSSATVRYFRASR